MIAFNLDGCHHGLVAAILGYEAGIGVRSGCFCAQMYVARLLGRDVAAEARRQDADRSDRSQRPGMVRASLGAHNTVADVDALVAMLRRVARRDYRGRYSQLADTGDFRPAGHDDHDSPDRSVCEAIFSSHAATGDGVQVEG